VATHETFGTISDFLAVLKSSRQEQGPPQPLAAAAAV